jgi:flavin-binding protein dodecin
MPTVIGKAAAGKFKTHGAGWEAALDNALSKASRLKKQADVFEVDVEFRAEIKVVNPGTIQQYIVVLKTGG